MSLFCNKGFLLKNTKMKRNKIKFKVCDVFRKTIHDVAWISWEDNSIGVYTFEGIIDTIPFSSAVKLLRFTGLVDRDGVEIYEDDVIQTSFYDFEVVKWDDGMAGFSPFVNQIPSAADTYSEWAYDMENVKVKGNINLKPELNKYLKEIK